MCARLFALCDPLVLDGLQSFTLDAIVSAVMHLKCFDQMLHNTMHAALLRSVAGVTLILACHQGDVTCL